MKVTDEIRQTAYDAFDKYIRTPRHEFAQRHDEYDAVCAALDALAPMLVPDWQPIDTAPKDGETYLVFFDYENGEVYLGLRPTDCPDDAACDSMGSACYPTHWMPLPAAPSPTNEGE